MIFLNITGTNDEVLLFLWPNRYLIQNAIQSLWASIALTIRSTIKVSEITNVSPLALGLTSFPHKSSMQNVTSICAHLEVFSRAKEAITNEELHWNVPKRMERHSITLKYQILRLLGHVLLLISLFARILTLQVDH